MRHRGPDDCGEWWSRDRRVGLAHRRLSILDLSPGGHQPMVDASGQLCIVFNGEIYNHAELRTLLRGRGHEFHTSSDTEVILASYREWGDACVSQLNGMFAFAVFDQREQRLFVARDRAGEKPLFYAISDGEMRFASELKALMADVRFKRTVDKESLDCLLGLGYIPGDRCILEGVRKLPPAHALSYRLQDAELAVWRYWQLPPSNPSNGGIRSSGELEAELERLLEDAVRRQLVADVPVGILLSGGVDSSLVTALAARAVPRVKTFTVRFPGYSGYDETDHARLIASHFGTEHIELDAAEATVDLLSVLARQFDEPMVDSSMIPTFLVSRLIRQHCTVALGGDGGDELFGGYHHYDRLLWMQSRLGWVPQAFRVPIRAMAESLVPVGVRGRNWLLALGAQRSEDVPFIAALFDAYSRRKLLRSDLPWRMVAEDVRAARATAQGGIVDRATRMDFENYLAEDILVKVDRASMLNSLEVRAPFLDYRVIEFAFGEVPSDLKATAVQRKILLKRLCNRVLPRAFDSQRKQGFSIPLARWLQRGPWLEAFRDVLLSGEGSPFDRRFVSELLDGQRRGRGNGERLFGLMMFEMWRREYGIALS